MFGTVAGGRRKMSEAECSVDSSHAWNAVYVAGSWRFVDCTWGSGSFNSSSMTFEKRLNEHFFLTDPEELIYTHFPYDEASHSSNIEFVFFFMKVNNDTYFFRVRMITTVGSCWTSQSAMTASLLFRY